MNQFIMLISFMSSMNFIQTKHPLAMGLNLLIQTILISLLCSFHSYSYWFSYILFLIMLGGMLVLFLYVTSLASNELFNFNMMLMLLMLMFTIMISFFLLINDNFMWLMNNFDMMNFNSKNLSNENNLIKLYNNPTSNMTMLMIMYLFLTLIIVVKITDIKQGPLRQNY
uniref:NADH-ubiquinone oxidoreductase chain 6 n=1 Tax=Abachrysa eureka TaxID=373809 RepID=A0A343ISK1_9NEOP|nr:NADH dehydrogenase subunit 6 [Abachrysa eureka]